MRETLALGGAVLLAAVVAAAMVGARGPDLSEARVLGLTQFFSAAAAAFASAGCALCVVRWRLSGEAALVWLAAALFVFGGVVVGLGEILLPLFWTGANRLGLVHSVRNAGLLVTLLLFLLAVLWPAVDTTIRPWRVSSAAMAAVVAFAALLDNVPSAAKALSLGSRLPATPDTSATAQVVLAGLWVVLAGAYTYRGFRERRWLFGWSGLMLAALALAELVGALADTTSDLWLPSGGALRMLGTLFAVLGSSRELERSYVEQRGRLFDTELDMATARTKGRLDVAGSRRRNHDVRNALMAIEGAALTIERHYDQLAEADRGGLARMLSSGIGRLQGLVADDRSPEGFPLAYALSTMKAEGRVEIDVAEDLVALGSSAVTAEAIGQLQASVQREAPEAPVVITARREAGWLVVRIENAAAGFPRHERRAALERRMRAPSRADAAAGLGLQVAARLIEDQGGDVSVDTPTGGGLAFVVRLPASDREPAAGSVEPANGTEPGRRPPRRRSRPAG